MFVDPGKDVLFLQKIAHSIRGTGIFIYLFIHHINQANVGKYM